MRMSLMRWELSTLSALAVTALVVAAVFGWAAGDVAIEGVVEGDWLHKVWHIGTYVLALAGVGIVWCGTKGTPWARGLGLSVYALLVFINGYVFSSFREGWFELFTEHIWRASDAMFVAFCLVAAVALWRWGSAGWRITALVLVACALIMLINFYTYHESVVWRIMNPVTVMVALALAADAFQAQADRRNV